MAEPDRPLRRRVLGMGALVCVFIALASVYNALSTPFEAPDEIGHFYYVVHLLQAGQLPVVPASEPAPNYEHEGVQPPLYYASAALFTRALWGPLALDLADAGDALDVNPYSTCAQPGARDNVVYFSHDPHAERFPYTGRVRVLHTVRLWSTLCAAATVAGVFVIGRLVFPDLPIAAWLAAGLTAFIPEFLFTAGAATNDVMVTAVGTWGVCLALWLGHREWRWYHALLMGGVAGLGALSKLSGIALLPLFVCVIVLKALGWLPGRRSTRAGADPTGPHGEGSWQDRALWAVGMGLLVVLACAGVAGWWFYRNWRLYGDLTGTRIMLAILPLRDHMSVRQLVLELPGLFRSWWGTFGCTAPPVGFHIPYLVLSIVGLVGVVLMGRRWHLYAAELGLLVAWLLLMFGAYVQWNWVIHAAKGRLLYPAIASVAVGLGYGLARWATRWRWLTGVGIGVLALGAAAVPLAVMAPRVAPPAIYHSVSRVAPSATLDGRFGSEIGLIGYDLDRRSYEPGETLDLTLYWHALAPPSEHLSLAIQLVSAIPGDTATLVNHNTWPGRGTYPTGNWRAGDVIGDRYTLPLPAEVAQPQAWRLQVIVFDSQTGARMPFTLQGEAAGDAAELALVRVGATDSTTDAPAGMDSLAAAPRFGDAVVLEGVRLSPDGHRGMQVALWWRSVAPLAQDAIVFVHLYDTDGQLLATADGPPLGGGFPVALWQPGDVIHEERTLVAVGEDGSWQGPHQLGVGWYDPSSGVRVPATGLDGERLPNDEYLLLVQR